jgi:putative zinc finger protein
MSAHEQFADDLALHALGALSGAEQQALEQHLVSCADCRNEFERLRGDAALLALSATGPAAPARSRERFVQAITRERHPRTVRRRRSFFELVPIFATAVVVLICILLWRENVQLRRRLDYALASDVGVRGTWTGMISDERCGASVHDAACASKCIGAGQRAVLVSDASGHIIPIADAKTIAGHEGRHVKVTGTLDQGTLTVKMVELVAVPGSGN